EFKGDELTGFGRGVTNESVEEENSSSVVEAVGLVQARVAMRAFDKRDNDFDRGLDLLNRWVSGLTGTPFQLRNDYEFAYLNVTNLTLDKAQDLEDKVKKFSGFTKLLGRLEFEGLGGEIWLYTR